MNPAKPELVVCADERDLAEQAARLFCDCARAAAERDRRFAVALAGGRTPRLMYERLALPPFREAVPWGQTRVFWGDERWVAPDDPDSNFRMAREALLDRLPLAPAAVHPMPAGSGEPQAAAKAYAATLAAALGEPPRFDLVLLGLGADGHVASLFPGSSALLETQAAVAANWVPSLAAWRLTLTLPVLLSASTLCLLVSGAGKAAVLKDALSAGGGLPVHRLHAAGGRLVFLADAAAAQAL